MGRAGRGGGGGSRGGSFGGSRGFSSHSGSSHRSSYSSRSSYHSSSHHSSHYGGYHHSGSDFSTGYILGSILSGSNPRRRSVSSTSGSDKIGLIIFIIVFALYILGEAYSSSAGGSGIQKSTIEREKLESTSIVESSTYVVDTLGWINDEDKVEDAMEYFYDKTGVQPFLLITDSIGSSNTNFSNNEFEEFANEVYDEEFDDEAHLVVIFYERNEQYRTCCVVGTEAKTVIDDEAREILLDYIDHYYYSDYDEDTMFSKVFTESADRIMKVTPSYGWIAFIFILIIVALCVSLSWWTKRKKAKLDEMNKAQQILDQDLNTFGASGYTSNASANVYTPPPATNVTDSSEVDELKKKYDSM